MAKTTQKRTTSKSSKLPIMALSRIEEKELILDSITLEKLENVLSKNGGEKSGLTISDVLTHLLLEKGSNGIKLDIKKNEPKKVKLSLPKAAWQVAEKSADKSGGIELSEFVKELVSKA